MRLIQERRVKLLDPDECDNLRSYCDTLKLRKIANLRQLDPA